MNNTMIKCSALFLLCLFGGKMFGQADMQDTQIWEVKPEDRICFALYTVHENTLKLTAQLYPIRDFEPFSATLQINKDGKWLSIAESEVIYPGYTAPFRIENWDDTQEVAYRVVHNNKAFYEGVIRENPVHKNEFTMAAFSCNSVYPQHGGDIPKKDIVDNLKKIKPDLLFFAGDQVYHHSEHLIYWLKFGRDFGDIIRNTPTICLPDDHDIGQANLWGAGGKKASERRGHLGGYYMPVEYVQEVERAQTSHLPDPYDPTPIDQGIGVYYTDLKWGGLSFAILEDRKFKSGLGEVAAQHPDIFPEGPSESLFNPDINTQKLDIQGAKLLGDRQLAFLENWTTDWTNAEMKVVLSQTIFAQVNNYSGKQSKELIADFDTNGWPQSGRNKALSVIRKSFSPMIGGDQHLASVVQHGIKDWGDAGFSFATPAIANFWMRWWEPKIPGKNKIAGQPDYTGDFLDGFQNKMTVRAVANPSQNEIDQGGALSTRAAGFGIIKFNKSDRSIKFECWGRNIDISNPESQQYPGWPVSISQIDNFNIKQGYELPILKISKIDQVVTIRNALNQEVFSSIRIKGNTYQPKTLENGNYHIEVGEGKSLKRLLNVSAKKKNTEVIKINL